MQLKYCHHVACVCVVTEGPNFRHWEHKKSLYALPLTILGQSLTFLLQTHASEVMLSIWECFIPNAMIWYFCGELSM